MEIIGLQIDPPFLRSASVRIESKGYKIISLEEVKLVLPAVKRLYIPKFKGKCAAGLSSKDYLLRSMQLNIGKSRHLDAALKFQSEGMTQIDPNEIISVPHSIQKIDGKVHALLFSASRDAIRSQVEEFAKLDIALDHLSCHSLGLVHYVKWRLPDIFDCFIVDIGSNEWTCALMEKGELKKSHTLDVKIEEMEGKIPEIRQTFGKTIFSFHRITDRKPIVFTGQLQPLQKIKELLMEEIKDAITQELEIGADVEEKKFAISIGLCLEQKKNPLQLLKEEFFPKKNWYQAGFYACTLIFLSLFCSLSVLFFSLHEIRHRKKISIESIQSIAESWDPALKTALVQDEERALDQWKTRVSAYSKEYPYILDIPRASQALSWLSHHPLLQACDFELNDFQYQLVEYPKIGSSKNRYRAKVDIQFRLNNLIHARQLHEALLKGDEFVDPAKEITWESFDDFYKVSFYLKSMKGPYVP